MAATSSPTPSVPRRAVAGWVLYDLANTIFSMGVVSLVFPLWVRGEVGEARADSVYGVISGISMGVIFVVSPLLGAWTDRARRRMPFLVVSTLLCVVATALLARAGFAATAALFIVANICYQAGLQFYDSLLPEVSDETNRGKIGGIGVGVGYLGSYLAVGASLFLGTENQPRLFALYAIAFALLSVPCFVFVRERGNPAPQPLTLAGAFAAVRETIATLRTTQRHPGLARFLVGRVFYTDAINTVISFMTLFTVNVALANGHDRAAAGKQAQFIMLAAITFAVAGGFVWGRLTDRVGPKRALTLVLWCWMALFALAAATGIFALPLAAMYVVACGAGFSLGGIWAADRPYMLRLTPPGRVGEFYGLYGMVGRFSAITGPFLWAAILHVAVERLGLSPLRGQGIAVLSLLGMTLVGYLILRPVSDAPRDWETLARDRA
ncbi:MAG: MFS transporter [Opitutae bacterium]|nr:MFS transporter [Opitutae bacterium]